MTQEEKQLLLKDLCARLPYKPMIRLDFQPGHGYQEGKMEISNFLDIVRHFEDGIIATIKPYLRPLSSMTEKEKKEFQACHCVYELHPDFQPMMCNLANELNMFDWLNAHRFDYRGLIEKGLALEAPKDMYKTK